MVKKLIAALTALTMCAALAGCGKGAEGDTDSSGKKTASAASQSAEESAADSEDGGENSGADAEESSDANAAESSAEADKSADNQGSGKDDDAPVKSDADAESVAETQLDDGMRLSLRSGNILCINDPEAEQQPTDEELKKMMEIATAQYRAAEAQDMKAFLDSFNLDIIRDSMIEMTYKAKDIVIGEEFDAFIKGQEVKYEVMDDIAELLEDIGDEDVLEEIYGAEDPDLDEMTRLINALFDSVNADREDLDDELYYYTVWGDELIALEKESENTTYAIIVNYYENHGSEMYCKFDMMILDNGYEYYIDDVDVWCIDGEYGVLAESAGYFETEELEGKTARDIYDMMIDEMTQHDIVM